MLGIKRLGLMAALVVVGLAPAAAAQAAAQPSTQDTQYLQAVHQVNLFEITAGNLAQQKGQNQQVKDLGKMFVTDHTQLDQTVQSTAQQLNVQLPADPTADQQKVLDKLNNLNGAEFDKAWVTAQLAGHVHASGTPSPGGTTSPGGTESPAPGGTETEEPAPGTTETPVPSQS